MFTSHVHQQSMAGSSLDIAIDNNSYSFQNIQCTRFSSEDFISIHKVEMREIISISRLVFSSMLQKWFGNETEPQTIILIPAF